MSLFIHFILLIRFYFLLDQAEFSTSSAVQTVNGKGNWCQYGRKIDNSCVCMTNYVGKRCDSKCVNGQWVSSHEYEYCHCVSGWAGPACDISLSHSDNYRNYYNGSIILLFLAAFLAAICVLCVANRRRRNVVSRLRNRMIGSRSRVAHQRRSASNEDEHIWRTNTSLSCGAIRDLPPKYEDAVKMPAFVAPMAQGSVHSHGPSSLQPPAYAECSAPFSESP